jgi:hypothetical protein
MLHCRRALVAAVPLLAVAAMCIGCGPKEPPPPGGAFTDPSQQGVDISSAARRPGGGDTGAGVIPAAPAPRPGVDPAAVEAQTDDYLQRAREHQQEQERLRQEEIDSAPPSDMWVPVPEEAAEAEEIEPEEEGGESAY